MLYELSDDVIRNKRLSQSFLSKSVGMPVAILEISKYPFAKELLAKETLPISQVVPRANMIAEELMALNMLKPQGVFEARDIFAFAECDSPGVGMVEGPVNYVGRDGNSFVSASVGDFCAASLPPLHQHFDTIRKVGFEKANAADSPLWYEGDFKYGKAVAVFPGLLKEKGNIAGLYKAISAVVLTLRGFSSEKYWGNRLGFPDVKLENLPQDGCHSLYDELLGLRRFQQVRIKDGTAGEMYCAVDSEMYANAALKIAGIGEETCEAHRQASYVDLLFKGEAHTWHRPALDSLEEKAKEPTGFYETLLSIGELKSRVFLEATGIGSEAGSAVFHAALREKIGADFLNGYGELLNTHRSDPGPIFSALQNVVDGKQIDDPRSKNMAKNILRAGTHFGLHL